MVDAFSEKSKDIASQEKLVIDGMNITRLNFTSLDASCLFETVETIMREYFPEMQKTYERLGLILADYQQSNEIEPAILDFSSSKEVLNQGNVSVRSSVVPTTLGNSGCYPEESKGYMWLLSSNFAGLTTKQQEGVIIHELCHLILRHSSADLVGDLCLGYPDRPHDILKAAELCLQYFYEYQAELCCFTRFPEYIKLIEIGKVKFEDQKPLYRRFRSRFGRTAALVEGLANSVKFLYYVKRNAYISNNFAQEASRFRDETDACEYQQSTLLKAMKKDLRVSPKKYLNRELFANKDTFLSRIMKLLETIGYNEYAQHRPR